MPRKGGEGDGRGTERKPSCCHGPRRPGAPSGAEKSVGGHDKLMEDVLEGGSVRRTSTSAVSLSEGLSRSWRIEKRPPASSR